MADDGGGDEETGDAMTSEQEDGGRRILFLDAYDSFTNNIVALLKETLGSHVAVHVRHMDLRPLDRGGAVWTAEELEAALTSFDAVVCGPGPGTPAREADVGAFARLWAGDVPVLGICLGFQSLAAHLGAEIRRLRRGGLHGMVRAIDHGGDDVFDGVPAFRATLYHSLTAYVGQDAVRERDWPMARWERPAAAPELVPLAWARDLAEGDGDGGGAERILMAARHANRPLWGIQYHPESVCTEPAARLVVRNWFRRALEWNTATRRRVDGTAVWADSLDPAARRWPGPGPEPDRAGLPWLRDMRTGLAATAGPSAYACRQMRLPAGVDTADVAQALGLDAAETLILDSSSTVSGDPLARSSILALDAAEALRVEYRVGDAHVTLRLPATRRRVEQSQQIRLAGQGAAVDPSSPWHVVSELWRRRRTPDATSGPGRSPAFRGGFVGFVTYEMGLSTLSQGLTARDRRHRRPDVCLVWVTKSLVLDHRAGLAWLQALPSPDDGDAAAWLDTMAARLQHSSAWREGSREGSRDAAAAGRPSCAHGLLRNLDEHCNDDGNDDDHRVRFRLPPAPDYERDVRRCQAAIRDGESYELCLTAQTLVTRPAAAHGDGASAWHLFCRLRRSQPAPFGSFVRLGGLTLISSSPECFLTHDVAGTCSMRPMKGTVRKSEAVSSLAEAKKILHVPKEEAENLMIVDLVRHDLHGVCGPGAVSVPELLRVEEYATVFQMSTVVRGQLPVPLPTSSTHVALTGFDVLAAALPPGSMTGAPKKRSCELLHALEPGERSVYAGVVGYLDVAGQADWSVTIRAMFRWDDEVDPGTDKAAPRREVWRIGAGGAVTTLSTPADERDEMFTKLSGPLAVLYDAA